MTTIPHIYDMTDLERDVGYIPDTNFQECIKDALKNHPKIDTNKSDLAVHKRMNLLPLPEKHSYF